MRILAPTLALLVVFLAGRWSFRPPVSQSETIPPLSAPLPSPATRAEGEQPTVRIVQRRSNDIPKTTPLKEIRLRNLPTLPPLPEGVTELTFQDFFVLPAGPRGLEFTDKIKSLNGKRVRIAGFQVAEKVSVCNAEPDAQAPGKVARAMFEASVPGRMLFCALPESVNFSHYGLCDDLPPQVLFVTVPEAFGDALPQIPGPLLLTGTLELGNKVEPDGRVSAVRLKLDARHPRHPARRRGAVDLFPRSPRNNTNTIQMNHAHHSILRAGFAAAFLASAGALCAAPNVSRLTPPSALFSVGDPAAPYTSRFLVGQRFDLQATVQPTVGAVVTSVEFKVDGSTVGTISGASLVTSGLSAGLPAGTAVASVRAYSNVTPGVHTFTATATLDDASSTTVTGNFEIVGTTVQGKKAKNVIFLIGDGMGASHRTAARIMLNGYTQGKANAALATDKMPNTAMVQTASLNSIITDSAPGAACYSTGNKSNNNQQGVFPDDTLNNGDNPRVELIGEYLARTQGKALGIVTTADVFDATPGAFGSHTQARGAGMGICDNYLDEMVPKANLRVLLGGGRKWFLPNGTIGTARTGAANDYIMPADVVTGWGLPTAGVLGDTSRDLIAGFTGAGFSYAPNKTTLLPAANNSATTKLLGLFTYSNMNIALDKINGRRGVNAPSLGTTVVNAFGFPDQPMLDEMTDSALKVLNRNANGFVLMVEGASIDKQAHNMDSERWILDMIEFDYAVEVCRQFQAANPDTLLIVTADHECAGVAIIGASTVTNADLTTRSTSGLGTGVGGPRNGVVGTYDFAGFPAYSIAADGYPTTTDVDYRMLIGYAANADRYEDWLTNELPLRDSQQPEGSAPYAGIKNLLPNLPTNRDAAGGFLVTGQIQDTTAAHTGGDIPLSAQGRGAKFFTGYMDNTQVFFHAMQAAIGGAAN